MHLTTSNVSLATSSFDRAAGNITVAAPPYNNFQVTSPGQPFIQGSIKRIKVAEVFFPYNVPTVCTGKNDVILLQVGTITATGVNTWTKVSSVYGVTIAEGYYTAAEMRAALLAEFATIPNAGPANLDVTVDTKTGGLQFENLTTWDPTIAVDNFFYSFLPYSDQPGVATLNRPQLYTTLGLRNILLQYPAIQSIGAPFAPFTVPTLVPGGYPNATALAQNLPQFPSGYWPVRILGSPYFGRYTDWVDITSTELCNSQNLRDSNTNQVVVRKDVLCRLYIADEISLPATGGAIPGSRPFTIHRQFRNPKVILSNNEISQASLNIALYDMYGQPLPLPATFEQLGESELRAGARDFGITLLAEEGHPAENVGYRF
jgi:hypothetical protein